MPAALELSVSARIPSARKSHRDVSACPPWGEFRKEILGTIRGLITENVALEKSLAAKGVELPCNMQEALDDADWLSPPPDALPLSAAPRFRQIAVAKIAQLLRRNKLLEQQIADQEAWEALAA